MLVPDMTEEDRANLVKEALLVSDDDVFKEALEKAKGIMRLDDKGRLFPKVTLKDLSNKQKVELYIVSRYLAKLGGLIPDDAVSAREIGAFTGLDKEEVSRRGSDLRGEGKVDSPKPGSYKFVPGRVLEALSEIEGKSK